MTCRLSPIDHASLDNWDAYPEAAGAMFATTHTPVPPWAVVSANDKRSARINAIMYVLHALPYDGKDPEVAAEPDPAIVVPPDQVERSRPRVHAAGHR